MVLSKDDTYEVLCVGTGYQKSEYTCGRSLVLAQVMNDSLQWKWPGDNVKAGHCVMSCNAIFLVIRRVCGRPDELEEFTSRVSASLRLPA